MRIDEETSQTTVTVDENQKRTIEGKITKRSVDNASQSQPQKTHFRGNRHRRSPQNFGQPFGQPAFPGGGFPQPSFQGQPSPTQQFPMNFNPYNNPNFGFSQQNANGNALGQSQNPFFNQNAGANTHSSNMQNPFGNFQNTGGSSLSSNLANDGLAGQVSAANTDQQNFLTALGAGQKNNAFGQSANFDPFGNLQATSTNAGNQHTIGADGERNQANSVSNAHNQNQFGNSDTGTQTLTENFEGNGVSGQKASSSSHASQVNNFGNFGANPAAFPMGNPGLGTGGFYPGFPQQGLFGRVRRSAGDAVSFPQETDSDEKEPETTEKATSNSTESENQEPGSLDSRFGLPGHPVRTFLRETLGGIFAGGQGGQGVQERGYGAYDNGPQYGGGGYRPGPPQQQYPSHRPYEPYHGQTEYERPSHYPPGTDALVELLKLIFMKNVIDLCKHIGSQTYYPPPPPPHHHNHHHHHYPDVPMEYPNEGQQYYSQERPTPPYVAPPQVRFHYSYTNCNRLKK